MHRFTNVELADMHFMYRPAQENGLAAQRMYGTLVHQAFNKIQKKKSKQFKSG